VRSRQRGAPLPRRMRCITSGTSAMRTTVASTRIALAVPTPSSLRRASRLINRMARKTAITTAGGGNGCELPMPTSERRSATSQGWRAGRSRVRRRRRRRICTRRHGAQRGGPGLRLHAGAHRRAAPHAGVRTPPGQSTPRTPRRRRHLPQPLRTPRRGLAPASAAAQQVRRTVRAEIARRQAS
jgi:hypothetical protein